MKSSHKDVSMSVSVRSESLSADGGSANSPLTINHYGIKGNENGVMCWN